MATYKNDIILIAGSGDFAFEAAKVLNSKNRLNKIILITKNYKISRLYKNLVFNYDIRDIENLIKFIKKSLITKILIIGYVQLPPIKEIKLSFKENFFYKNYSQNVTNYINSNFSYNFISIIPRYLLEFIVLVIFFSIIGYNYLSNDNFVSFKSCISMTFILTPDFITL